MLPALAARSAAVSKGPRSACPWSPGGLGHAALRGEARRDGWHLRGGGPHRGCAAQDAKLRRRGVARRAPQAAMPA
eukprot:3258912-Lingulodinium_polyedra.AAC.1